jgi:hypothetical protein
MPDEQEPTKKESVPEQPAVKSEAAASEAPTAQLGANRQMRSFYDRELAMLTGYLLDNVSPKNLRQQNDLNTTFEQLDLERFIQKSGSVDLSKVATRLTPYAVSTGVVAFVIEALNNPMTGRTARIIGAGSSFWTRLLTDLAPVQSDGKGRKEAVPQEVVPAEVPPADPPPSN